MDAFEKLMKNNRAWAARMNKERPGFFEKLKHQQTPEYLWIGCADSRVPANEIAGLLPGEMFVHRNVANLVVPSDLNAMSVVQFAVDVLRVKHIIVCGHYECSGVRAAMGGDEVGLADNWLAHVRDVRDRHEHELAECATEAERYRRLCELNVSEQLQHLARSVPVTRAWKFGQDLTLHGLIYGVGDGLLHDLGLRAATPTEMTEIRRRRKRG